MDRSRRAARRNAGYGVAANDTSARALRIARRNHDKSEAESSKHDKNNTHNSEQSNSRKKRCAPKVTRQSLESIGKKARHKQGNLSLKINDTDTNRSTTTKDNSNTAQNDIIDTNNIAKDITIKESNPVIDTNGTLRCTDSVSFANEFEVEGKEAEISIMQRDNENDDDNQSGIANSIGTSLSRKSKEIAIERLKQGLLPPMPPQLDNFPTSELVETQQKDTSRAGTPTSIFFTNDNDEFSIESFQSRYNNSSAYSQTSIKSKHITGKIEKIDDIITVFNLSKSTKSNLPSQRELRIENLKINSPKRYATLISTLVKCIKVLTDVMCPGPNQNDVLKSLASTKPFSSVKGKTQLTTLVRRNRKTLSISDTQLLYSIVQTGFNIMEMSPKGSV